MNFFFRQLLDLFTFPLVDLLLVPALRRGCLFPHPPESGVDPVSLPQLPLRRTTPPRHGVLLQVRDANLSVQGQLHVSPHFSPGEDRSGQGEDLLRPGGLRRQRAHALPEVAQTHQDGGLVRKPGKKGRAKIFTNSLVYLLRVSYYLLRTCVLTCCKYTLVFTGWYFFCRLDT